MYQLQRLKTSEYETWGNLAVQKSSGVGHGVGVKKLKTCKYACHILTQIVIKYSTNSSQVHESIIDGTTKASWRD